MALVPELRTDANGRIRIASVDSHRLRHIRRAQPLNTLHCTQMSDARDAVIFYNKHTRHDKMLVGDFCLPGDICIVDESYYAHYCGNDTPSYHHSGKMQYAYFVLKSRARERIGDGQHDIKIVCLNDGGIVLGRATFPLERDDVRVSLESYAKLFDYAFWSRAVKTHIYVINNRHPWLHKHFGAELSMLCIDSAVVIADRDGVQMVQIRARQYYKYSWWWALYFDLFKHEFSETHLLQRLDMVSTHDMFEYLLHTPTHSKRAYLNLFSCSTSVPPSCSAKILQQRIHHSSHEDMFIRRVLVLGSLASSAWTIPTLEEQRVMLEPIFALHERAYGECNTVPLTFELCGRAFNRAKMGYDWYRQLAPRILQLCLVFSTLLSPYVLERVIDCLPYMLFPSHVRKIALIIGCCKTIRNIMEARSPRAIDNK